MKKIHKKNQENLYNLQTEVFKDNIEKEFKNYAPALYLKDDDLDPNKVTGNDLKIAALKEIKSIKSYSQLLANYDLFFSGYEPFINNKKFSQVLQTYFTVKKPSEHDVFEISFNVYDTSKKTVIQAINENLSKKHFEDKNHAGWKTKIYVEQKFYDFISQYHFNQNFYVNIQGNQVLASYKRLKFHDWSRSDNLLDWLNDAVNRESQKTVYIYAKYLQQEENVKLKVVLKKKKRKEEEDEEEKETKETPKDDVIPPFPDEIPPIFPPIIPLPCLGKDHNCYKVNAKQDLKKIITNNIKDNLTKTAEALLNHFGIRFKNYYDNHDLLQASHKKLILNFVKPFLSNNQFWNSFQEEFIEDYLKVNQVTIISKLALQLNSLSSESIVTLKNKIKSESFDNLYKDFMNFKNNEFEGVKKQLLSFLKNNQELINQINQKKQQLFSDIYYQARDDLGKTVRQEIFERFIKTQDDCKEVHSKQYERCFDEAFEEVLDELLDDYLMMTIKNVFDPAFEHSLEATLKNTNQQISDFIVNDNAVVQLYNVVKTEWFTNHMNLIQTKLINILRDQIIKEYLKLAIKRHDNHGYQLVWTKPYGPFSPNIIQRYYVTAIKKQYLIILDNELPLPSQVNDLQTYLVNHFSNMILSEAWFQDKQFDSQIMQLIQLHIGSQIILNQTSTYFDSTLLKLSNVVDCKNQTIEIIMHYPTVKNDLMTSIRKKIML